MDEFDTALLAPEYTQWTLTDTIRRRLRGLRTVPDHESLSALERYLMALANMPRKGGEPSWATIYRLDTPAATAKFREELAAKSRGGRPDDLRAIDRGVGQVQHDIAAAFGARGAWAPERVSAEISGARISCTEEGATFGRFRVTKTEQPLARMISVGGPTATLRALLRYDSLGAYGCSWGTPYAAAQELHASYGVRYECFASPLNSRLYTLPDTAICSLFLDTDAPFRSLGSFFGAIRELPLGARCIINPPYTEDLLAQAAQAAIDRAARDPEFEAYFMAPVWPDSLAYKLLTSTPYVLVSIATAKGAFRVEDSLGAQKSAAATVYFAVAGSATPDKAAKMAKALDMIVAAGAPHGSRGRGGGRRGGRRGRDGGRR